MQDWAAALFAPQRIALIGASETPGKVGHSYMRNLIDPASNFAGGILPVHPTAKEIMGRPAVGRLCEAQGSVDLAIIAAPPGAVLAAVEDCASAGVPVAVIVSAGFAEAGVEGRVLQERVIAAARSGNVRIVGPNCFGVISTGVGLNASMALGMPKPGGVGLFTQSGAYGMAAYNRSHEDGIGFSRIIAAGNKADIDETDVLRAFAADPDTHVIAMLLESISDGKRFFEAARAIAPLKPIIVMKSGRSAGGKRAAESHTAALASDFIVTRAALRQAGVHVVEDGGTLLDLAAALDKQPVLTGNRVAIITNSGGTGVELTDLLEARGMQVPALSAALQAEIAPALPAFGSAVNPIDVTTDWKRFPDMYGRTLARLLASEEIDVVVPVLLQRSALAGDVIARIIDEVELARNAGRRKPVHVCWVAPRDAEANRQRLLDAGIPCHTWPSRTAEIVALCRPTSVLGDTPAPAEAIPFPEAAQTDAEGWLSSEIVFALLKQAGLPVAPWSIVSDAAAAANAAREVGMPVVLKAESPGLVHKSDAGGVLLGLSTSEDVEAGFLDLRTRLGAPRVLVQRQAAPGLELILGARRDPLFGPVLLVGLGGIWVEALGDVALRLPPFGSETAEQMLDELRGRALLSGIRGNPGVDVPALAALICRLSHLVAACPWLAELDINPLIAGPDSFMIVDARIRTT